MSHMMTETELYSPTSTSSSSGELSPHKIDEMATYKKSNKPMMEKKRRARINSCLSQLKSLVLQAMKKDNSQYSKLEKADILELTVRHLRNVQRYQNNAMAPLPDAMTKYRAGFNECANEVVRYLGESQGVNDEARTRIISHLASILTPINSLPLQQTHTPILPAPLQQVKQEHHQPHLQQLNLQQQQNQSLFLTSSPQPLTSDSSNGKSVISYPSFLASTGNTININHVMSNSPTAFQCPVTTGIGASSSIQIPCLATAAMAATTTTQLQLLPNTAPSGHVALVLAPQSIPTMNLYTTHQGDRLQVGTEVINSQLQVEDCKYQVAAMDGSACLTNSQRSQRHSNIASYQLSSTQFLARPSLDHPHKVFLTASTANSSGPQVKQSNILKTCSGPNTASALSGVSHITNTNTNCGLNVVRTTSTWRPW